METIKDFLGINPLPVLIVVGCLALGMIVVSASRSSTTYSQQAQAPQVMRCPACGGAGQVERPALTFQDGPTIYSKQTCGICGGTGKITPPGE